MDTMAITNLSASPPGNRRKVLTILSLIFLLLLCGTAAAVPQLPEEFYGNVTIGGVNAPQGTVINATISGVPVGSLVTTVAGKYGGPGAFDPRLAVTGSDTDVGLTIIFWINGVQAQQTAVYTPGATMVLDLNSVIVPAPVASFSGTPTTGTAPLGVTFTDLSTNTPTAWSWNFGDGGTSALQNPVHTYLSPGTYTVSLTASNAGGSNTSTRTNYIVASPAVGTAPVAGFTGTPTTGFAPLTVSFTDTTTNTPTVWQWDFGDGSAVNASVQNPVHTYLAPGTYTVSLTASNAAGANTSTRTNYIVVSSSGIPAPVAGFTGTPTAGTAPLAVTFTDTTTNTPTVWTWNFGDGTTSSLQNPVHTYLAPGTYTVSLTASNAGGANTFTRSNYIVVSSSGIPAPVASFSGTPTAGTAPLAVTFTDTTTNTPTVWTWTFGDGTTSSLQNPVHTYLAPGTYTVSLTASNAGGASTSTLSNYIVVSAAAVTPPLAGFSGTPTSGVAPLTVTFTDTTANAPSVWAWTFGDGTTSSLQSPVHTYTSPGSYTVSLTASNAGGANTSTLANYIVVSSSGIPAPVASFTTLPTSGTAPLAVTFTDTSTNSPTAWQWTFGDGTTSTLQNPIHTYLSPGTYTVSLTASNAGGSSTATQSNYIAVSGAMTPAPVAAFTGSPTSGVAPLGVTFTDSSTNTPTVWTWNFGDGTGSALQSPIHTYLNPGTYTVSLTVSNAGGSNTSTRVNYIVVSGSATTPPVAAFSGTPTSGTAPLTVTFTDSSANTPTVWQWTFGDGDTTNATVQNPVHTYLAPGTYTVTLTASNAGGSNSVTQTNYIVVSPAAITPPVAAFSGTPTSGVAPLTVEFTDSSTNTPTVWQWTFGDGDTTNATVQNPVHTYLAPGTYTVTLTASNAGGSNSVTQTNYIVVSPAAITPPVAAFSGTPTSGTAPLTVTFTDSSTNSPTVWQWVFGDGSTVNATDQNPVHTYLAPGTYTVSLTASNAGGSNTFTRTGYITVSSSGIPAPVAAFSGTPTSGTAPLTVTFTDSSTNTPTAWQWTFGDGDTTNATDQNPVHTYLAPGTYTVALVASNAGGSNMATMVNYITVSPSASMAPVVSFSGSPTSGVAPLTVAFADSSTNAPTIWHWTFGDGDTTNATDQNPVHTYLAPGTYTVTLTASNAGGANSSTRANYIVVSAAPITPPVAGFSGTPTSGTAPLTVTFADSSTNTPTVWQWTFGDGDTTNATDQNPVHTYLAPGTYTVTLTASNAGGSNSFTRTNYIVVSPAAITPPVAGFSGTPTSGVAPLTVEFTDSSANSPTVWQWVFGDGSTVNATDQNPVHTYLAPGTYTVSLTASNAGGSNTFTRTGYITVSSSGIPAPVAAFSGTPTSGTAPLTVTFTDSSTNTPTAWLWTFGDGDTTNATDQNPVHTYAAPGTYTVSLTASNAGGSNMVTMVNYITVSPSAAMAPVVSFSGTPTSGVAPLTVAFTDSSTNAPTIWHWTFGDGDTTNATDQNPVHTYLAPGTYTVTLTASNAGGANSSTRADYIVVSAAPITPPTAAFSGTPTSGQAPLTVVFTDSSSDSPTVWQWNFGDGDTTNATDQNPVHTYLAPGTYTVSLTVSNAGGADTATRTDYIVVSPAPITPPTASFTGSPTSGTAPLPVEFTDSSSNSPTVWQWTFGDGSTSTLQNPEHTYLAPGTYTVSLTVSNAGGSNTQTRTNYITVSAAPVSPPVANFAGTPTSGTAPLPVTFTDLSTNSPTVWQWSFGDGTFSGIQNPSHTYSAPGNYTVSLTASNAGGSNTQTRTNYIRVSAAMVTPPVASFTGTPTSGVAPLIVTFTDTSTNTPTLWQWTFGDGGTSTTRNPSHTYLAPGTYTVSLTASNAGGSNTSTRTNYITVTGTGGIAPVANFSGTPRNGKAPLTVVFTDLSANSPTSWTWSFGDGSPVNASVQNPVHTYATVGTYTVSLTASNAFGSNTTTKTGYITVTNATGSKIGVFRPSTHMYYRDYNGNGAWDGAVIDRVSNFGNNGDDPVSGDWNHDGITEIGVFRPSTHMYYRDYNGNGAWDGAVIDRVSNFGIAGDIGASGDWNGDGITEIGVFRPSTHMYYRDYNGNGAWDGAVIDRVSNFGMNGDTPVSGDWNLDGITEIGVYRVSTRMFYLDYNGNGLWDGPTIDKSYIFGIAGDLAASGDWNADGITEIGAFRPSTHLYYQDYNGNGIWDGAVIDRAYSFGITGDKPVSGAW
jgi:PKD repeat protein